ncbi:MAG: efflux RND transporter periplasmic adaptor subunit [Gammaproteobacteria bacterium]
MNLQSASPLERLKNLRTSIFKARSWRPWLILLAAFAVFILLRATKPEPPPVKVTELRAQVAAELIQIETLHPEVLVYGVTESPGTSKLTAAITAYVESVPALEGQTVAADALLIQLDPRDASLLREQRKADLLNAEAEVELQRTQLERMQTLLSSQAISQQDVDRTRAAFQQAEASVARNRALLEQAELDLVRTEIRAPFAARVLDVSVSQGERVRAGDPLVSLHELARTEVRAQIPARFVAQVRSALERGETLTARGDLDGVPLQLRLDRLAANASRGSGGIDGLFRVDAELAEIALGRAFSLRLQLPAQADVVALPFTALYSLDRVYRITAEDRLEAIAVEWLGERMHTEGSQVLVRSPLLQEGDRILMTQLPDAIQGRAVQIIGAEAAP